MISSLKITNSQEDFYVKVNHIKKYHILKKNISQIDKSASFSSKQAG